MKLHSLAIATLVSTLCLSGTTLWAKTGTENLNVTYNNTKIYLKDALISTQKPILSTLTLLLQVILIQLMLIIKKTLMTSLN